MMFDLDNRAKPVLKWAGGKSSLLAQLVPLFPTNFGRYFEPFLGGGAVFLSLRPETNSLLNDFNPEIVNLYQVVKKSPHELILQLDKFARKYSEDFYYELREQTPKDPVVQAARTLFLNKTGFNGLYRQNAKGKFNVPFGRRPSCPALYEKENLLAVSDRLGQTEVKNFDFAEILAEAGSGDFVYCDPPYEPLSSTSSFNSYTGGGFSQDEQRRLFVACKAAVERGASVAVSNSSADFILELYKESRIEFVKARRAINSCAEKRGPIAEVLVLMSPQT